MSRLLTLNMFVRVSDSAAELKDDQACKKTRVLQSRLSHDCLYKTAVFTQKISVSSSEIRGMSCYHITAT